MKAYIVVTEHNPFWLPCGTGSVDQDTALIGSLATDDVI